MSPEGKTAAAIAAELGVSRQTVHRRLKGSAIAERIKAQSIKQGKEVLYTAEGERLIKSLFDERVTQDGETCNTSCNVLHGDCNVLQGDCNVLQGNETVENSGFHEERVTQDGETCNTSCNVLQGNETVENSGFHEERVTQDGETCNTSCNVLHRDCNVLQGNETVENSGFHEERVTRDSETCNTSCNVLHGDCNVLQNAGSQSDSDRAALIDSLHKRLEDKDRELEVLRSQLIRKDEQITELQAQAAQLTRTLDNTVMALTAAQALHAADKQQQLLTDSAEPPRKLSFWERLRAGRSRKNETQT